MAGGFSSGAISGAMNAGMYGGNALQAALLGGLAVAAIAGLVQGAIELNGVNGQMPATASTHRQYGLSPASHQPPFCSQDEEPLLARMIFAEAGKDFKIPGAMEAVGWTPVNRMLWGRYWPDSVEEVILQPNQFTSVGSNQWAAFNYPLEMKPMDFQAYLRAFEVAKGVCEGTIADPAGAHAFQGSPEIPSWMGNRGEALGKIGSHYFFWLISR